MASVMNFFRAQDEARGRTTKLVVLLIFAIVAMTVSIYALTVLIFTFTGHFRAFTWIHPVLFLSTGALSLIVILGGAYLRTSEFEEGGFLVAQRLGGRPILANTQDLNERKLLNIVQEMALASGMPVPQCFVLDRDATINAFAAGNSPQDAVVTLSRGALENLTRDELQGVIGHEFSHIAHGDMVLNLRIIGLVAGLTALSQLGYIMMRTLAVSDDDDRRSGAALALVGLVVFLGGLGGVLIARIIQASVSRQREYLADAASVQFTRNPLGLAGALKKAAGMASLPHESVAASLETQHMYFVSVPSFYEKVFSTHPPIEDRIKRVDPTFNGVIPPFVAKVAQPVSATPSVDEIAAQAMKPQLTAAVVTASATPVRRGYPSDLDIQSAVGFHGELPPVLRDATREPVSAMGLVLAMVLRRDPAQRAEQLKVAQAAAGGEVVQEALRLELLLRDLPAGSRVPLLDLALPTLREMSSYQLQVFRGSLHRAGYQPGEAFVVLLIESMMHRYLGLEFEPISSAQAMHVEEAAGLILSAVVQTSSESPEDRVAAYQRGVAVAGFAGISSVVVEHALTDLARLEEALAVLTTMNVASRRNFVRACGVAVLYDNQAEPAEVEILRAVSDAIGISLATGLEH